MAYIRTIVCLAYSRKESGRCVAGRVLGAAGLGAWIRPVSARPTRELTEEECRYDDGRACDVLDVVELPLGAPQPEVHQQENHLAASAGRWRSGGRVGWRSLEEAAEDPLGPLWVNGHSSTFGENDRVPAERLNDLARSLYLLRPEHLRLTVGPESTDYAPLRRRVRAEFTLRGYPYRIVVTDPRIEDLYLACEDGSTPVDRTLLCVSLGEEYHGFAYKLVAAVITPDLAEAAAEQCTVYTIGHSNHPIEKVLALLARHGVTAVADVRSQPYSRFNPQVNRENLRTSLRGAGISYVFMGRELGARPEDRSCYEGGTVSLDRLADTGLFQEGLTRVVSGAREHRIALLCAEKDPLHCHRTILVSRHLAIRGVAVQHILEDGALESHDAALDRLLDELNLRQLPLFGANEAVANRDVLVGMAYGRRGAQIAYTEKVLSSEGGVGGT